MEGTNPKTGKKFYIEAEKGDITLLQNPDRADYVRYEELSELSFQTFGKKFDDLSYDERASLELPPAPIKSVYHGSSSTPFFSTLKVILDFRKVKD